MSSPPRPGLGTPEGLRVARQLLRPQLPHDIHDYILEGLCKAIDGMVQERQDISMAAPNPSTALTSMLSTYPAKPALVAVFPTKGLEEEMVHGLLLSFIDI